jgi:ABC-type polysaccharide/polyol phosphate export permease
MLVFRLFFGKLAHVPSEGMPYPIFYYSALLPWMYFAAALQNATNAIVENQRVITKVYFPRVALPLAAVLASLVDFGISFFMFVALMFYYGIHLTAAVIWFPVFLLLAVLTALGVGLWLSALNAIYRDVRYVMPFVIQFWMFASPVAYPSSLVPEKWGRRVRWRARRRSALVPMLREKRWRRGLILRRSRGTTFLLGRCLLPGGWRALWMGNSATGRVRLGGNGFRRRRANRVRWILLREFRGWSRGRTW